MSTTEQLTESVDQKSTDNKSMDVKPVENTKYTYATLMETSEEESESWYYFIRYQGNEEALKHLNKELRSIDWVILDDLCTFDLELDYLVSEQTAKEMTKIDMNHTSHHRKFDGVLQKIVFPYKKKDSNKKKIKRVTAVLGYGQIEEYVDNEDIDPEDLLSHSESESSESSESESSESESVSDSDSEDEKKKSRKGIPPALMSNTLPRFAKAKRRQRR